MNAIALCPTCHANFDAYLDPGFGFVPLDVDYFIEFERRDYEHRERDAERGIQTARSCPTKDTYKAHHAEKNLVSAESYGGLYKPIQLKRYAPYSDLETRLRPKPWGGSPMAALRRGFLILGSMRAEEAMGEKLISDLFLLRKLYTRGPPPLGSRRGKKRSGGKTDDGNGDDDDPGKDKPKFRRVGKRTPTEKGSRDGGHHHNLRTRNKSAENNKANSEVDEEWILGPELSCLDVIKRYESVLSYSFRGRKNE